MAEPYLRCPANWYHGTLEPNPSGGLIARVDTGSTPKTTVEEYWDGDVPWLTPKEIARGQNGLYVSETERMITAQGLESCSARLLAPGTVMLTKRAPVGAVAVNTVPMTTNQGFLNFTCGPRLRPLYLAHWLRANKPYLDLIANGSTYPEIYKGDLFEFEIAVPTLEEQDSIIDVISALEFVTLLGGPLEQSNTSLARTIAIRQQTGRLARIADSLIPRLLSGQLDASPVKTRYSGCPNEGIPQS